MIEKLEEVVQEGERLEIPVLRARAVCEVWNGHIEVAFQALQKAKTIVKQIGLPLEDKVEGTTRIQQEYNKNSVL